jgi:DNA-binding IclR family transcriptional regulator
MADATAATRALRVLRALAAAPGPMTASALARDLQLPRSSTYHLLNAMESAGFVAHYVEDERWGLGVGPSRSARRTCAMSRSSTSAVRSCTA